MKFTEIGEDDERNWWEKHIHTFTPNSRGQQQNANEEENYRGKLRSTVSKNVVLLDRSSESSFVSNQYTRTIGPTHTHTHACRRLQSNQQNSSVLQSRNGGGQSETTHSFQPGHIQSVYATTEMHTGEATIKRYVIFFRNIHSLALSIASYASKPIVMWCWCIAHSIPLLARPLLLPLPFLMSFVCLCVRGCMCVLFVVACFDLEQFLTICCVRYYPMAYHCSALNEIVLHSFRLLASFCICHSIHSDWIWQIQTKKK